MIVFVGPEFLSHKELPAGYAFLYTVESGKDFFLVNSPGLKLTQIVGFISEYIV